MKSIEMDYDTIDWITNNFEKLKLKHINYNHKK